MGVLTRYSDALYNCRSAAVPNYSPNNDFCYSERLRIVLIATPAALCCTISEFPILLPKGC